MARRERVQFQPQQKENYQHFKSEEMEIVAAYCYGFDNIYPNKKQLIDPKQGVIGFEELPLPKLWHNQNTDHKRPWTTYERFIRAVAAIQARMEENPMQNLHFAAAYLEANSTLDSGDVQFEPEDQMKAKEIYDAIIGKSGFAWGNEAKLKECFEGWGGKICREVLKFKENKEPEMYPPFSDGAGELANLKFIGSALKKESPKGNWNPTVQAPVEPPAEMKIESMPEENETRGPGRSRKK